MALVAGVISPPPAGVMNMIYFHALYMREISPCKDFLNPLFTKDLDITPSPSFFLLLEEKSTHLGIVWNGLACGSEHIVCVLWERDI